MKIVLCRLSSSQQIAFPHHVRVAPHRTLSRSAVIGDRSDVTNRPPQKVTCSRSPGRSAHGASHVDNGRCDRHWSGYTPRTDESLDEHDSAPLQLHGLQSSPETMPSCGGCSGSKAAVADTRMWTIFVEKFRSPAGVIDGACGFCASLSVTPRDRHYAYQAFFTAE